MKYSFLALTLLCAACNSSEETTSSRTSEPFDRIFEYTPAPGQFINEPVSGFDGVTTPEKACAYAEERLRKGRYVSLGGWGGYLVAGFAQPVENSGGYDLLIAGNAFNNSSEPGIVWVMRDENGNGLPDDVWYELRGSRYDDAQTLHDYEVTYTRAGENRPVPWRDNRGASGEIARIAEHTQPDYFPLWVGAGAAEYTFRGVRLPDNVEKVGDIWIAQPFEWGYADNWSKTDRASGGNRLRIADAVTAEGAPANLERIDFVKIQTGVNRQAPLIGEVSTEVCGIQCYRTVTK